MTDQTEDKLAAALRDAGACGASRVMSRSCGWLAGPLLIISRSPIFKDVGARSGRFAGLKLANDRDRNIARAKMANHRGLVRDRSAELDREAR